MNRYTFTTELSGNLSFEIKADSEQEAYTMLQEFAFPVYDSLHELDTHGNLNIETTLDDVEYPPYVSVRELVTSQQEQEYVPLTSLYQNNNYNKVYS